MSQNKAVAITGDIIGSSTLNATQKTLMNATIDAFSTEQSALWPDWQFQQYRGDSVQALLTNNRSQALRVALLLQTKLIGNGIRLRAAVGVGEISFMGKDLITSDGTALQLSGTWLDQIKKQKEEIAITGSQPAFAAEWQVHSVSLNYFLQKITVPQAQALYLHLQNKRQDEIANLLNISQPSVHQRLQAAGAFIFTTIVARFETSDALV
ncbi:sigma-70 family RNA polymerase sigma factor [Limnovirga soli]|uniref:Uncharacterized protein n=1 Tax=Limnovirga soli TaxID=2656915 RepID=A0A8J8FFX2_9BACT|nr:sigma-70 family RNA polymerase sigma factor [Limnovirga soli]NNV57315.1 hypothetical protein [Limnovirga soli]